MREIKFRAWDGKNMSESYKITDSHVIFKYDNDNSPSSIHSACENKHFLFIQYTGLKDKNGKEIYEGDIISFGGAGGIEVCFDEELAAFSGRFNGYSTDINEYLEICEIIGNIYENPELLDD